MTFLNRVSPTQPIGSHPTPPWLAPEVLAHQNKVNESVAIITIIISLLLLTAALRCYKKYHRLVLATFLFILALLSINVLLFSYFFPTFFPDLIKPKPSFFGVSGTVPVISPKLHTFGNKFKKFECSDISRVKSIGISL